MSPTDPQSWNRYAYVSGHALTDIDPLGLRCGRGRSDACVWGYHFNDLSIYRLLILTKWAHPAWPLVIDGKLFAIVDRSVSVPVSVGYLIFDPWAYFMNHARRARDARIREATRVPTSEDYIKAIADGAPTTCGGGFFGYAGVSRSKGGAEGFLGGLGEWDSNSGGSLNGLVEGGGSRASGGAAVSSDSVEPLLFLPFGAAPAGHVLSETSVGIYAGTSGRGLGAYVNVTTNAHCQQLTNGRPD